MHALNMQSCFQCTNDLILQCISAVALCRIGFWPLHSIPISLNVVWYLVYNECTAHGTTLVKGEQIIFHLVLQVYCSPSLKQYLHSPVMTLLACNIERTVSILCAYSGGCACVCVLHVHGCVVVCTCALVCVNALIPSGGYKSTSILTCISNHTSTVLASARYFSGYIFITDTMWCHCTYV